MRAVKAIVIDLDGTTVGRDERISPVVASAVRRAAERVHVSIATGREPKSALRYARELGLTAPLITDNGSLILDPPTGALLWGAPPMRDDLALAALSLIDEYRESHGAGCVATTSDGGRWDKTREGARRLSRITALDLPQRQAERLESQIAAIGGFEASKAYLPYNDLWAVDIARSGIDKGSALLVLCRMLALEPSEIAAVGDSWNDLSMLRAAGVSFAMRGAPAEIRRAADYIVPTVERDGLAEAIERILKISAKPFEPTPR